MAVKTCSGHRGVNSSSGNRAGIVARSETTTARSEQLREVCGHRGYFLRGAGVMLNMALMNYGIAFLQKKGYIPMQPPFFMMRNVRRMRWTAVLESVNRGCLADFRVLIVCHNGLCLGELRSLNFPSVYFDCFQVSLL